MYGLHIDVGEGPALVLSGFRTLPQVLVVLKAFHPNAVFDKPATATTDYTYALLDGRRVAILYKAIKKHTRLTTAMRAEGWIV